MPWPFHPRPSADSGGDAHADDAGLAVYAAAGRVRRGGRLCALLVGLAALAACQPVAAPPAPVAATHAATWADLLDRAPELAQRKFHFVMAASGIALGAMKEVDTQYAAYTSRTMHIGVSVPILYLRTTLGATQDWVFDPGFGLDRRCKERPVAEDSLDGLIRFALDKRVPVQFILNGGVWANSSCNSPEWDVANHLQDDVANCQWTQNNIVYPRDYLKNLTGSIESPELARSLTYNVYAAKLRYYKKRNLQAAAALVADFAAKHPELFIGVTLDADTYMNPFFEQREWFDYNPGTLRQFRHWLRGTGPYAGTPEPGVPDLSAYRRKRALNLSEVNALARATWTSWDAVDPPRKFPGTPRDPLLPGQTSIFDDPWFHEWDAFRKHVIALHYTELSQWVHEAGVPAQKIFSAQGFIAPGPMLRPFAVRLDSHGQNYDSAGVSIEGSIPRFGHLGAILYGEAAENRARMEGPHSLLATFARMDPGWAVVEFNSTDLRQPTVLPTYAQAYRSFRDFFNYDASFVAAMAWNGSNGLDAGKPGYLAYTAWRNTPAEDAMRDFLASHADVPRGARVWTFGTPSHADDDGWTAENGHATPGRGVLDVELNPGVVALVSPSDQVIPAASSAALVLGAEGLTAGTALRVLALADGETQWQEIAQATPLSSLPRVAAGVRIPLAWPVSWRVKQAIAHRLRIEIAPAPGSAKLRVLRIAIYPEA